MLLLVKAIRRFSVRTVLPEPLEALGELASNLRWSWHPPTRELFESIEPRRWAEACARTPSSSCSRLSSDELAALAADDEFVAPSRPPTRTCTTTSRDAAVVPAGAESRRRPASGAPTAIAYFSPGVRHHRGAAAVLRRPRHPRRRPPQDGVRPRRARSSASASSTGPATSGSRSSRDGWQVETYPRARPRRPAALAAARGGRHARRRHARPARRRQLHAHVWKAQVGRVPLLLLDSDVPGNDETARAVTERLYGGGGDTGLEQELLLGIGGVRALRLWSRLYRRADAGGLPHQRGPRRLPRRRAHPRARRATTASPSTRRSRPCAPPPSSPPHPGAGRHRPLRRAT